MCCWPKCYHVLNWLFPSKTWFFGIYLNFQLEKSLENQYLPHSESKSYQTNSIKSCSSRSLQQHLLGFNFNFQWKNHSIFKNSYTASPNAMKPSWCTPPPRELSKETKNMIRSILVPWISSVQTNKLPSFIDLCPRTGWHYCSTLATLTHVCQIINYFWGSHFKKWFILKYFIKFFRFLFKK